MALRYLAALAVVVLSSRGVCADQWPRFRGPNGSGIAQAEGTTRWESLEKLWAVELPGSGHGSPIVWDGRVFVLCGDEASGSRVAVGLSDQDGATLWKYEVPGEAYQHHRFNSVASSTPAADAERVYFCWGSPEKLIVAAFEHGGRKVWEADLGPVKREHGYGCSPIVQDGLVILSNDQESDCAVIALDAATGQLRWKTPRTENHSNFSTPCIYQPAGSAAQVIVSSWHLGVTGFDLATGRQLWQKPVFGEKQERAIASPFVAGELVFANCGFTARDKHVVVLRPGATAGAMEEAWRIEKGAPHIPSPIVVGDRAYLWNDQGVITCAKLATGEAIWTERVPGEFFASPVSAGGRIFGVDKTGVVTVVRAGDKFEVVARYPLGEATQATPAISDGCLYARTLTHLHCLGEKK